MKASIRREAPEDRERVFEINCQSFETDLEARLIEAVRGDVEPLVSLVAEVEGRVVGHILFTPVTVEENPRGLLTLGLGPMSILPGYRNRGIGGKLVERGFAECRRLGAVAVVVLGHEDYYPRFGFQPARPFGLWYRSAELDPNFMAIELEAGALANLSGQVFYHQAFEEA